MAAAITIGYLGPPTEGSAAPCLECSFRRSDGGWGFSFDIEHTVALQKALDGDRWQDWTAVACTILPIRGTRSDELTAAHASEMINRRAGKARLTELPAGRVVHHDAPARFAAAVEDFLSVPG